MLADSRDDHQPDLTNGSSRKRNASQGEGRPVNGYNDHWMDFWSFTYVTLPLPYLSRQLAGEEEGSDGEDDIHPEVVSSWRLMFRRYNRHHPHDSQKKRES